MNEDIILEEEAIAEERAEEARRLGKEILGRPIRDLPAMKPPITVGPQTTIAEAVERMTQERIGCMVVVENEKLVGVFTERDVLTRVVARGVDPRSTAVAEVMTRDPESLSLEDGIAYALNKMSVGGFRHIPLVDAEGRPTGVVAMRAIVDYIVDLFPTEVLNLPPAPALGITREREGA